MTTSRRILLTLLTMLDDDNACSQAPRSVCILKNNREVAHRLSIVERPTCFSSVVERKGFLARDGMCVEECDAKAACLKYCRVLSNNCSCAVPEHPVRIKVQTIVPSPCHRSEEMGLMAAATTDRRFPPPQMSAEPL